MATVETTRTAEGVPHGEIVASLMTEGSELQELRDSEPDLGNVYAILGLLTIDSKDFGGSKSYQMFVGQNESGQYHCIKILPLLSAGLDLKSI